MARQSIQGFVELASGLGELTKSRAMDAANELVALAGLEGTRSALNTQAGALAEDLMTAAESNRRQLMALVRREVDAAMGRVDVGRLAADVNAVTAAVAALAGQLEELATTVAGRARAEVTEVAEPYIAPEAGPARVAGASGSRPTPARRRPVTKAAAKKAAAGKKAPAKKAPAKKSAAKKSAAKKSAAKKSAAKKAPAKKAPAKKAPAKKATGRTRTSG